MTQFEVMVNLAGIKTKEGEDFVKVIKMIECGYKRFDLFLSNGSCIKCSENSVSYLSQSTKSSWPVDTHRVFVDANRDRWQEWRQAITKIVGLCEF